MIINDPYLFYSVMGYPLPRQKEFFAYRVWKEPWWIGLLDPPSWWSTSQLHQEYCDYLKKRRRIWQYIPFIEAVYVGNSLTFNAINKHSDIDLFIITNVKRLWTWRLFSVLVCWLLRIKRTRKKTAKRFCLSFTISRDATNLQEIKLKPYDPYLIYRIAHLVPVYQEFDEHPINIYKDNSWIQMYLPNHPLEQTIDLWIWLDTWKSTIRKSTEWLLSWYFGDFFERLIRIIRLPIILRKRKKRGAVWSDCIVSDTMLKFHYDKRKLYSLKRKLMAEKSK